MGTPRPSLGTLIGGVLTGLFLFVALFGTLLAPYEFDQVRSAEGAFGTLETPNSMNLLGTTSSGFDVFSRLILGANTALIVMALSVCLALSIGLMLGLVAGFFGGWIDKALSVLADALFAMPALLIALVLSFSLSGGAGNKTSAITAAVVAEGLTFSARYFRVVRAEVRTILSSRYVEAARVSGFSNSFIVLRHLLPNSIKTTPVLVTQNSADAVLTLAGLGFLGVGIGQNSGAEWGSDLAYALTDLSSGIWWTGSFSAVAVALTVIGLTLLGEGVSDSREARYRHG
jgi:peptide/nickel transport system permease protein